MTLHFREFQGDQIQAIIDDLGNLRITVFREFPYLYEGSLDYEREYLETYSQAKGSFVCLVYDGDQAVGATTCIPMSEESKEFQRPFLDADWDISAICYLGESILLPAYRGRGIGKEFFQRRHAQAARLGLTITAFCAVDRAADHPLRPADYRPLDSFWQSQGYARHPELQTTFRWLEIGQKEESANTLTFWVKQ